MSPTVYRCSAAARWLPRVLAGSLLTCALAIGRTLDPGRQVPISGGVGLLVAVAGAFLALQIVRGGSEVRAVISLHDLGVEFAAGEHKLTLPWSSIRSLDFVPPFLSLRRWLPAGRLIDDESRPWRLPALLEDGDRLIEDLLDRADRSDLRSWSEARGVGRKMGRAVPYLVAGYGMAGLLLLLTVIWVLR